MGITASSPESVTCDDGVNKTTLQITPTGIVDDKGWEYYTESPATLSVTGARDKLLIDGTALTNTTNSPIVDGSATTLWNTTTNKIEAIKEGDAYLVRLQFVGTPTANDDTIQIQFDIGGGIGIIDERLVSFPKGMGVARNISITTMLFAGSTFVSNGCEIYLEAGTGDTISVTDPSIVVTRIYTGKDP